MVIGFLEVGKKQPSLDLKDLFYQHLIFLKIFFDSVSIYVNCFDAKLNYIISYPRK